MWTNSYWANYWTDTYWPAIGEDGPPPVISDQVALKVLGMGLMGKARVHQHPEFSRVKQ